MQHQLRAIAEGRDKFSWSGKASIFSTTTLTSDCWLLAYVYWLLSLTIDYYWLLTTVYWPGRCYQRSSCSGLGCEAEEGPRTTSPLPSPCPPPGWPPTVPPSSPTWRTSPSLAGLGRGRWWRILGTCSSCMWVQQSKISHLSLMMVTCGVHLNIGLITTQSRLCSLSAQARWIFTMFITRLL